MNYIVLKTQRMDTLYKLSCYLATQTYWESHLDFI